MPPLLDDQLHHILVVLHLDRMHVSLGMTLVRHVDQKAVPPLDHLPHTQISLDLRVLAVGRVDDVVALELSPVLDEPVGDEQRNIVLPLVTRRGTEHDPSVVFGDLEERLHPGPRTHQTLLIKYEERSDLVLILVDVVPAVYVDPGAQNMAFLAGTDTELGSLLHPVELVPLPRSGDDIDVHVMLDRRQVADHTSENMGEVESQRRHGLASSYTSQQDFSARQLANRLLLMRAKLDCHIF